MIQIAIHDNDFRACSQLEDYIRRQKEGHKLEVEMLNTGKEFEKALEKRHYDLISLNIVMRDRSGVEPDRFIREELGNDTNVITYMSVYRDEYMPGLFQSQPLYFLRKPIKPEDFQNVLYKACEKIEGDAGIFESKPSRTVYRIPLKDILYFEGDNRRVKIVTAGHTYHCYPTLENPFSRINVEQADFMWLRKSYTISLRYMATSSVRIVALFDGSEPTVNASFEENALRRYEGCISKTGVGPGDKSRE